MREDNGARSLSMQALTTEFLSGGVSDIRLTDLLDNIPEMVFLKDSEGYNLYEPCIAGLSRP